MTIDRKWIFAGVAALLVIVIAAVVILRDDDDDTAEPSPLSVVPQLDTGGVALASLLTASRSVTYHATYTSKADAAISGGTTSMEVWNTKGKSRVNTTLKTPDGKVVETASILVGKTATACNKPPDGNWSCAKTAAPVSGDPAGLVASLQARLEGRSVTEKAEDIAGEKARCFSVSATAGAEALEACVDKRGVLLRLTSSEARIEVKKLDASIPGDIFDPPA